MRKTGLLLAMLLVTGMLLAQPQYPDQSPSTTAPPPADSSAPPPNAPQGYPQTTMPPPDTTAPPPVQTSPQTAAPEGQSPVLGTRPATTPTNVQGQVPAGTEIRAVLDTALSTKTSHEGDQFTATVAEPVNGTQGAVLIPAGSKIRGEVTESEQGKTLPAIRGKAKLNLRFRDVQLPNGQVLPLTASLVSVNDTKKGTSESTSQEGEVTQGRSTGTIAKDVGIGAGLGTVAGLIFGSPLKGLAIGAIAGGGYVLATGGKDVNLPAESGLVLKLDRPLDVTGATTP